MSQHQRQRLSELVSLREIFAVISPRKWRRLTIFPLCPILTGAILNYSYALWEAVEANNLKEVKQLVQKGADVNSTDEFGFTLLVNALAEQELPIVDALIENGAEVFHNANRCKGQVSDDNDSLNGRLLRAITDNDVKMVKMLLSEGAEVNACDDVGFSMLVNALALTDNAMINFLVANGATMKTSI